MVFSKFTLTWLRGLTDRRRSNAVLAHVDLQAVLPGELLVTVSGGGEEKKSQMKNREFSIENFAQLQKEFKMNLVALFTEDKQLRREPVNMCVDIYMYSRTAKWLLAGMKTHMSHQAIIAEKAGGTL